MDHGEAVESGAARLGEWIRLHLLERWPAARVEYEGAAPSASRYWRVEGAGTGTLWIAATEPALLEPGVREIPALLEGVAWRDALVDAQPDGLLITTGARLFVWDRERDRGTRLVEPERGDSG